MPRKVSRLRRREQPGHGLLHLVDEVVDDGVIADLDALALGRLAGLRIGAHIEAEHDRARGRGEPDIGFGDAADARMHDARANLVGPQFVERRDDGLDRALHVTLDEERELLGAGGLEIGHHLLEAAALTGDGLALAPLAHAVIGDLPRAGLVLHHGELIARLGRAIEAQAPRPGWRGRLPRPARRDR